MDLSDNEEKKSSNSIIMLREGKEVNDLEFHEKKNRHKKKIDTVFLGFCLVNLGILIRTKANYSYDFFCLNDDRMCQHIRKVKTIVKCGFWCVWLDIWPSENEIWWTISIWDGEKKNEQDCQHSILECGEEGKTRTYQVSR